MNHWIKTILFKKFIKQNIILLIQKSSTLKHGASLFDLYPNILFTPKKFILNRFKIEKNHNLFRTQNQSHDKSVQTEYFGENQHQNHADE